MCYYSRCCKPTTWIYWKLFITEVTNCYCMHIDQILLLIMIIIIWIKAKSYFVSIFWQLIFNKDQQYSRRIGNTKIAQLAWHFESLVMFPVFHANCATCICLIVNTNSLCIFSLSFWLVVYRININKFWQSYIMTKHLQVLEDWLPYPC